MIALLLLLSCDTPTPADTACPDPQPRFTDADGDGFGDPTTSGVGCGPLVAGESDNGLDCDDTDPSVNPGASEAWYDGVDQDCDGRPDDDADQDGFPLADDCDDADPAVHPWAPDTCADGLDADCDGVDPACVFSIDDASSIITYDQWPNLYPPADLNGDGLVDLILYTDYQLWLIPSPPPAQGALDKVAWAAYVGCWYEAIGPVGAFAADLSGDGYDDLVTGLYAYECYEVAGLFVVEGPILGDVALQDGIFISTYNLSQTSEADVNDDGWSDVLAANGVDNGVYLGPFMGSEAVFWTITVDGDYTFRTQGEADLDGDGALDLVAGRYWDCAGDGWVVRGPLTGDVVMDTQADLALHGVEPYGSAFQGMLAPGDMNGDGRDDLVITAPLADDEQGRVYLWTEWMEGEHDLSEATAIIAGTEAGEQVGGMMATPGDLDGDGVQDLAFLGPDGWTRVLPGPFEGAISVADASWLVDPGDNYVDFVTSGDVSGDGVQELIYLGQDAEISLWTLEF